MTGRALALVAALAFTVAAAGITPAPMGFTPVPAPPRGGTTETAAAPEEQIGREAPESGLGALGEVWRVPMTRKEIALTFDDGPYPFYTPLLLHELERSHAVGTFFLVGRSSQEFPELVEQIVADGDEIGNHTFNHYKLTRLSTADIERQIADDSAVLEPFAKRPITLFRPPHGRYDHRVVAVAHSMGYETIFWNDSPQDTKDVSAPLIVERVLTHATPGGIVLLHNGQYHTVEALPIIIDRLRAEGYTFVTVSRLLEDGGIDQ